MQHGHVRNVGCAPLVCGGLVPAAPLASRHFTPSDGLIALCVGGAGRRASTINLDRVRTLAVAQRDALRSVLAQATRRKAAVERTVTVSAGMPQAAGQLAHAAREARAVVEPDAAPTLRSPVVLGVALLFAVVTGLRRW